MSSIKSIHLLSLGDLINDTYEVQFFIGEGAFGEVYRVKHKYLGIQVLKVFKDEYYKNSDLKTITNEAKILSKLNHPNIVRVFETNVFHFKGKDHFFISMGFVSGETLGQLLKRKIQLPFSLALSIQKDLLNGLKFVQEQKNPIIHRDINTDNILLSYEKEKPIALLSDFGLAITINSQSKLPSAAGRLLYFAPECFLGIYLTASDVFSAAIVFYRMLTGMHPWEYNFEGIDNDTEQIATMILQARRQDIRNPSYYNSNCSSAFEKVILKALSKDIEDRYKTASQFLSDLNKCEHVN